MHIDTITKGEELLKAVPQFPWHPEDDPPKDIERKRIACWLFNHASELLQCAREVAEAERRGERKAWEEAKGILESEKARVNSFRMSGFVFDVSIQIIDAKLNALK